MKKLIITCLVAMIVGLVAPAVEATIIGDCTNTGYTFMGGFGVYHQDQRDYFLTGNSPADAGWWAFGWLKFGNLPGSTVGEAWLSLECYKDMNGSLTPGNPMDVTIYAVDADVTGITTANVVNFKENHIVGDAVAIATLTGTGFYSWDITSIVNDWITDENYGLVVIGWDDEPHPDYYTHPYFAGLPAPNPHGMAPALATEPIPEPATVALLGIGSIVTLLRRKRG